MPIAKLGGGCRRAGLSDLRLLAVGPIAGCRTREPAASHAAVRIGKGGVVIGPPRFRCAP